jgi:hypothetical protein
MTSATDFPLVIQLTDSQQQWQKEYPSSELGSVWDNFEAFSIPSGQLLNHTHTADIFDLYPLDEINADNFDEETFQMTDDFYVNRHGGMVRGKQCTYRTCERRAQSSGMCKTHGGGARCSRDGCQKSSQGGGLCRGHGGGSRCKVDGCTKGTQRHGLCFIHGGVRLCSVNGCAKKDRGNGRCIGHGGGKRCEVVGCIRSVRKGNLCQGHMTAISEDTRPAKKVKHNT